MMMQINSTILSGLILGLRQRFLCRAFACAGRSRSRDRELNVNLPGLKSAAAESRQSCLFRFSRGKR